MPHDKQRIPSPGPLRLVRPNYAARSLRLSTQELRKAYPSIPHQVWPPKFRLFPIIYIAELADAIPEDPDLRRTRTFEDWIGAFAATPQAQAIGATAVRHFEELVDYEADRHRVATGTVALDNRSIGNIVEVDNATARRWIEVARESLPELNIKGPNNLLITPEQFRSLYHWQGPGTQPATPTE